MATRRIASIFALLIWPICGLACPTLTEPDQIREAREDRLEVANSVKEVWNESDQVLIGRIISTTEETRPASEVYPREDPDNEVAGQIAFGQSIIEPLRELKGVALNPLTLTYMRNESTIEIGCRGIRYFRTINPLMETYRYLLYVREGQVIRANRIVDWFDELDVGEELRMLNLDASKNGSD